RRGGGALVVTDSQADGVGAAGAGVGRRVVEVAVRGGERDRAGGGIDGGDGQHRPAAAAEGLPGGQDVAGGQAERVGAAVAPGEGSGVRLAQGGFGGRPAERRWVALVQRVRRGQPGAGGTV